MTLTQIYDGDLFLKNGVCRVLREKVIIPHPLKGVQYSDNPPPEGLR
jgi:hypothetical protein